MLHHALMSVCSVLHHQQYLFAGTPTIAEPLELQHQHKRQAVQKQLLACAFLSVLASLAILTLSVLASFTLVLFQQLWLRVQIQALLQAPKQDITWRQLSSWSRLWQCFWQCMHSREPKSMSNPKPKLQLTGDTASQVMWMLAGHKAAEVM